VQLVNYLISAVQTGGGGEGKKKTTAVLKKEKYWKDKRIG